jgi:hypothetical protein
MSGRAELLSRLRISLSFVIENLLTDEEACSRITCEHLAGQDVLFPDVREELNQRIRGAKLSDGFDELAACNSAAELDWEQVRATIGPAVEEQVAVWINLAQVEMLLVFGRGEEWREQANRMWAP